ncbi:MAG: hypothetical protein K0Q49_1080 [Haloplasmataceae bacterium]|nr:hypothetical protein [Haloplasmataceae bacterium]
MVDEKIHKVKINGLLFNVLCLFILFPILYLIYYIKIQLMNEFFSWNDYGTILVGLIVFLVIFISSIIVHELIKFVIYKIYGVSSIKMIIKDHMFFLYSGEKLSIKQAKVLFSFPYLIFIIATIISTIFFNFFIAISFSFVLVVTSDDFVMYLHLRKFKNTDSFIQEKDFLGFQCLEK